MSESTEELRKRVAEHLENVGLAAGKESEAEGISELEPSSDLEARVSALEKQTAFLSEAERLLLFLKEREHVLHRILGG